MRSEWPYKDLRLEDKDPVNQKIPCIPLLCPAKSVTSLNGRSSSGLGALRRADAQLSLKVSYAGVANGGENIRSARYERKYPDRTKRYRHYIGQ